MSKSKKIRRKIRYSIVYFFVKSLIALSNWLPRIAWLQFCGWLGRVAYYFAIATRRLVTRHLTIAFKHELNPSGIKDLSKKVFEMLGKTPRLLRPKTRQKLHRFTT